jgi:fumarylacetoacetate (FAA) hydrolase
MKLATLRDGSRDGVLAVVHPQGDKLCRAVGIAPTLQAALDGWERVQPQLRALSAELALGRCASEPVDPALLLAPLPRAYEWVDGSAYINHIVLVRRARGAQPPATLRSDPLVYQGGSGVLLGPRAPLVLGQQEWGLDFEAEVAVILGDTPAGTTVAAADSCIRLVLLANDVTYRNLVPAELDKGFGFFGSKPATAFSPFAVTPDELGSAWQGGRLHLAMRSYRNDELMGDPDAGEEMHFSFFDLIAHITKTRAFTAGTILGSGTVSNVDAKRGVSCLAEKRVREQLDQGKALTSFLQVGERVRIEMLAADGSNIFGSIEQEVQAP